VVVIVISPCPGPDLFLIFAGRKKRFLNFVGAYRHATPGGFSPGPDCSRPGVARESDAISRLHRSARRIKSRRHSTSDQTVANQSIAILDFISHRAA
jgi:hypothetical protein